MRTVKIYKHSTLGFLSLKFEFESSHLAIVDTWSPLQELSTGNYTIEMKDLITTEIELNFRNYEKEVFTEQKLPKGHFLVISPKSVTGLDKLDRIDLNLVTSITEMNDGSWGVGTWDTFHGKAIEVVVFCTDFMIL